MWEIIELSSIFFVVFQTTQMVHLPHNSPWVSEFPCWPVEDGVDLLRGPLGQNNEGIFAAQLNCADASRKGEARNIEKSRHALKLDRSFALAKKRSKRTLID